MKAKGFLFIPSLTKGGAERVISILSNNLSERGYTIFLIFLNQSEHAYSLNPNVKVIYLNTAVRQKNLLKRLMLIWNTFNKLFNLVRREKPDFMISFITSANIWSGIAGNFFKIPYIVSERNTPDKTVNKLNPAMRKMVFEIYKRAKAVVAPSEGIMLNLKRSESFNQLDNAVVINNPVTVVQGASTPRVHPRKFILAVGRLHPAKGFDRLIEAFSNLPSTDTDLLIAGKGNEKEKLENLIKKMNLSDRIFLVGAQDHIHDYYKQCEIFVLSSRNEGYPNVLIEAMSSGAASIAFDCNYGPSEIIKNGINGILVPNDNIDLLAEAMNSLIKNDEMRDRFSSEAVKIAEENSIKKIMDKWENLILDHA